MFSEYDRTVYRILADTEAIRINDERDLPRIDEKADGTGISSFRLAGTALHESLSSVLNEKARTYCIATGWECVEFICLNEPLIESIGIVEDSRASFH
ncbi:hypothetical protein ASS64_00100 [Erythrobacter sp. AP23]|nr:hypothetical protein ASS64_00100 [Erythrobacter sp. AP23]